MVIVLSFAILLTLQHPEILARFTVILKLGVSLSEPHITVHECIQCICMVV